MKRRELTESALTDRLEVQSLIDQIMEFPEDQREAVAGIAIALLRYLKENAL